MKDMVGGNLDALQRKLSLPFPEEYVQQKRKGGTSIDFVPYTYYVARLNEVDPFGWSCEVPSIEVVPSGPNEARLLMTVCIKMRGRTYTGTGVADAGKDKDDWGGAHAEAFSQAFRRACMQFGMGLYMYHDGEVVDSTFAEDVDDGHGNDLSTADPADAGPVRHSDSGDMGGDGAGPDVVDAGGPEADSPTETQMTRMKQLYATGVYDEEELTRWRASIKEKHTKGNAGRILREMKDRYETKTGEPFDPEGS